MPVAAPTSPHLRFGATAWWRALTRDRLIAGALVTAGLIHLILIPAHFAESLLFGAAFVAIAALQLTLAALLLRRPGPTIYRLALAGSLGLVTLWAATRLVTPPTGADPEEVDLWGVLASGLELAVVVLLVTTVPASASRIRYRAVWALASALGFAALYLLASGSAGTTSALPGAPWAQAYPLTGSFSLTVPGLVILLDHGRLYLTLPWSTGLFLPIAAGLLAAQVYMALGLQACESRLAARRQGVVGIAPGLFAAPVCCGAPLLSFLGTGAVLSLVRISPALLIGSCLVLAAGVWRIRRQLRAQARL